MDRITQAMNEMWQRGSFRSAAAILAGGWAITWAVRDYTAWIQIKGGFPQNPLMWALSYVIHWSIGSNYATHAHLKYLERLSIKDKTELLASLPAREPPTPQLIKWSVPHRQLTQRTSPEMISHLYTELRALGARHDLLVAPSVREAHSGLALYAIRMTQESPQSPKPTFAADLIHIHAEDGSIHVTLHPKDALCVVRKSWGVRFPLAYCGIFSRGKKGDGLSDGLMLVYAPRNEAEVPIIMKIIEAGVHYSLTTM
ncbi:hypothetical protein BKA62DRAFT_691026 [Auriculariales sp. MPI-PUGE-AT-0066]|nr:hypothetical protein BKA62DRAFT_691026 [Auriculariales sp. MPI-PUGE-AT-0066]